MEIVLGIIVIAVVVFLCFYFEKDKKRVEGLVEKKIEKPNQIKMIKSTNNVVYVAKDKAKEEEELTSFALALKEAIEQLEREEKRKKRERQLKRTRRQEAIRQQQQQADCATSYTQSFEPECIDDSRNRHNDTSSSSSYSSGSSYSSSSSSYDSSSSSSSSDSSNNYSSSSWD